MERQRIFRLVLYVLVFPWGIYVLARRVGVKSKGWAIVASVVGSFVVIGVLGSLGGNGGSTKSTDASAPAKTVTVVETTPAATTAPTETKKHAPPPEPKANIYVIASKSFCTYTGVDDIYTGDGHVQFWLTLKNSGDKDGSIDVTPVRRYDDGNENRSAMDQVSVDVPAGQVWKGRTQAMTYKAHEHEITDCALLVDGKEIPIKAVGI